MIFGIRLRPRMLVLVAVSLCGFLELHAESWPTYRHDARRSGVTSEELNFPLKRVWERQSEQPPQAAWTGPAKWDAYSGNSGLQSMRNFDPCFYVTVSAGRVFFGSSVDDAVHALDAATGREDWVSFTDSAVRFPPTIDKGRVYFGSDDGFVYCCDESSGALIWKFQAAPHPKRITSNRKLISLWPVRTGVLIQDGSACFGASLVPWNQSYLWKVDAQTGTRQGEASFCSKLDGVTLQGALLASSERIYVPQGRAAPLAFDFSDGRKIGAIGEAGGVFCILTEDEQLLAGPKTQKASDDEIRLANTENKRSIATFGGANRIVIDGPEAWIPVSEKLKCLDRASYVESQIQMASAHKILNDKKLEEESTKSKAKSDLASAIQLGRKAWRWEAECPPPSELVKAGDTIFVGLQDEVRAYDAKSGSILWSAAVEGAAHGLVIAEGRLFVSTGLGHLYAFEPQ